MTQMTSSKSPIAETAPSSPHILRSQDGPIVKLTLNRPGTLNSLSMDMLKALQSAVEEDGGNEAIRAIIVAGAGRGFCAGHDLKEIHDHRSDTDNGRGYFGALFNQCTEVMLTIARQPVPVIAEVHGVAAAAGCQLVASCDMAIAAQNCKFAVNGVDSGLFCSTPQVALSRNIPRKAAMEMLVLGEKISADRALSLGLINRVVDIDELHNCTQEFAMKAAAKPRRVVALGKAAFYRQIELSLLDAYAEMNRVIVDNLVMPEAVNGIDAFLHKKKPQWDQDPTDQ